MSEFGLDSSYIESKPVRNPSVRPGNRAYSYDAVQRKRTKNGIIQAIIVVYSLRATLNAKLRWWYCLGRPIVVVVGVL